MEIGGLRQLVARNLTRACELDGWTPTQFASYAGIPGGQLEAFLEGRGPLSALTLERSAAALQLTPWALLSPEFDPDRDLSAAAGAGLEPRSSSGHTDSGPLAAG